MSEVKIAIDGAQVTLAQRCDFALPTEELLGSQWHLRNEGFHHNHRDGFVKGADARVIDAWIQLQSLGSPEVVVAIIDDVFDLAHPDLGGPGKIVAPRDFTRDSADPSCDDDNDSWHGTACAGVAVGNANDQLIVGVAPACRLMPVRWGPEFTDAQVEAWFDWVREHGAWVVSCSWGSVARVHALSPRVRAAIARCAREGRGGKGTVICFAAGNHGRDINRPPASLNGFATHPDVIAVAASTSLDQRAEYSDYGDEIWICAPSSGPTGWGITTSDSSGPAVTHAFGGTSSACPLVAGVCALILSANPNLTAEQVKHVLRDTARRIGPASSYVNGRSREYGFGCVNAHEAVVAAQRLAEHSR